MANLRSTWDEQTWAAHCQKVAQTKAKKREERRKAGITRKPTPSLWAMGVKQGLSLLEDSPGEVPEALDKTRSLLKQEFSAKDGEDAVRALMLHERRKSYYQGFEFALAGGKRRAAMFARAAPEVLQLVAAS